MKKVIALMMGSVAMFTAQAANATTYSPTGAWSFSGTVDVNKGIALTCTLDLDATTTSSTATATPALSGGAFGLCGTIGFTGAPYNVSYNSSTSTLTIEDVYVNTITSGDCAGDISGTWDEVNNTITIDAVLPAVSGGGDCTIAGTISLTSPGDVSIT
ncbi:hypothetical protein [Sphingopyxis sp.]|jgi:hypothetical protein|uniref:hypothetical protein n=1 Tax=Sphingopyxis sp. TaxID=1908224 RepID=UPI002FC891E3